MNSPFKRDVPLEVLRGPDAGFEELEDETELVDEESVDVMDGSFDLGSFLELVVLGDGSPAPVPYLDCSTPSAPSKSLGWAPVRN